MRFRVKALREPESVVSLVLDAPDEADAARQVRATGLHLLSLRRDAPWSTGIAARRGGRFPLAVFAHELLALLGAGLSLVEAIGGLADKEEPGPVRAVLDHVRRQLEHGRTLSQAMHDLPDAFPALFVAAIRATERTGDVPEALRRYLAYHAQVEAVRAKLVSASLYPALLLAVGLVVVLFLLGYVVPRFSHVFEDFRGDLPLLSRLLLDAGRFLEANVVPVAALMLGAVAMLARLLRTAAVQAWIGARLQAIPSIGSRIRVYRLGRFCRTLAMLLRGGTPVVAALHMAAGLLGPALRNELARAARLVAEGRALSDAMAATGLATPLALRMLQVGEESGRMAEMLEHIAAFCDEEIARWVDRAGRLFEPLLMAFIGIVIGVVVVLMYMPVFELAGRIQ